MLRIHNEHGLVESYSKDNLKSTVVHACRAVQTPLGAAEKFAEEVELKLSKVLTRYKIMTSRDLKRLTKNALNYYHPDAAEVYALEEAF